MRKRWTVEEANQWYAELEPIRGCNYLPRTAINSTEMWQASTFDPQTIRQELGWARRAGYNSVRVFVQFLVWQEDAEGLNLRLEQFLSIAHGLGISTVPVLFDDCAFAGREPYLGKQDDPVPGVHNGGWTPSPGLKVVVNGSARPALASYVTDVVGSWGGDERILFWDLYNEPGNSRMGEQSLPLMEEAFDWARQAGPEQPLTVGAWQDGPSFSSRMSRMMLALSDIISFHCYGQEQMEDSVSSCRSFGRPVICSEWLRRSSGNTVADALPLFARGQVGWYNWGLVAGRTQTFLDWRSKAGDSLSAIWQHDMFHADGTAYDSHEIELIKQFDFS